MFIYNDRKILDYIRRRNESSTIKIFSIIVLIYEKKQFYFVRLKSTIIISEFASSPPKVIYNETEKNENKIIYTKRRKQNG